MRSKSITRLLPLLLMTAIFLNMPGVGGAAMWIGLQGGANFVADGDVKGELGFRSQNIGGLNSRLLNVKTEPAALGGVIVGYDFVKEGFLGYDWPNWLKYFSLALDFTYNNFSQKAQDVTAKTINANTPGGLFPLRISEADGYIMGLSLLFIAKYGFFSATEFPFGRLIPYAGVGPALYFSVVETPSAWSGYPSSDCVEVGVVTEGGVRYMVLRNVSLDAAFRYRYVVPSYDRDYDSNLGQFHVTGRIIAQQFSAIFRVNYHF